MVRAASFDFAPAPLPENTILPGLEDEGEKRRMARVMADLAVAFALDIDLASTPQEPDVEKWPPWRTIGFAVVTSLVLWALIAGLIAIL